MGLSFPRSVMKRKRTERRRPEKKIRMVTRSQKKKKIRMGLYRKKRRRRTEMEIPMDVVMGEILTRLPTKSLMRFKCVSKLWSTLISSRYFSNRFLTVPSRPHRRIFMCLSDAGDLRNSVTLSLSPDTTTCSFVVDHGLAPIPRMGGYVLQNLSGFMCYTYFKKPRIYNPATRQLVTLPAAIKSNKIKPAEGEGTKAVSYYFGHDPVTDQYKVVCSSGVYVKHLRQIKSEHRVFVLKAGGGGSWKKAAPTTPADFLPHFPAKGCVCIDGVIYYLGWTGRYTSALVSFHIGSREFTMIQVPRRDGGKLLERARNVSLIEYGGKATIIDQTNLRKKGMLDLWAVEDGGKKKWSRKTLVLQACQLHLVDNETVFNITGTTQNGKVLLIPKNLFSPFHILSYDLGSNDMRKIDIKGVPDQWFGKDRPRVNVMLKDQSESLVYLEA